LFPLKLVDLLLLLQLFEILLESVIFLGAPADLGACLSNRHFFIDVAEELCFL
jgi:hypothetical protein